jgi:F-type H+-transporting ATPase subunit 6
MLSRAALSLRSGSQLIKQQASRNFGATAVVAQKATDPIQQLFVDKIREYAKKSK